jgi:hypothetical protein
VAREKSCQILPTPVIHILNIQNCCGHRIPQGSRFLKTTGAEAPPLFTSAAATGSKK